MNLYLVIADFTPFSNSHIHYFKCLFIQKLDAPALFELEDLTLIHPLQALLAWQHEKNLCEFYNWFLAYLGSEGHFILWCEENKLNLRSTSQYAPFLLSYFYHMHEHLLLRSNVYYQTVSTKRCGHNAKNILTELEMHYIAVLYNLFHHISSSSLSFFYRMTRKDTYVCLFLSVFPSCFDRSHTLPSFAERVKVIVGYSFCLYETPLKIAVNGSGWWGVSVREEI